MLSPMIRGRRRHVAFYISGHGFGHAARQIELIGALRRRQPDLQITVRTTTPRWLFDLTLEAPVTLEAVEVDTGAVQLDSLVLDEDETIWRAWVFHRDLDARAAEEAGWLRAAGVDLVVGDIPPLAFAAASRAGCPAVAIGNFTWDWIYEAYPAALRQAPRLVPTLRQAYARADLACRLPLGGGFAPCRRVVDVPFIARAARREPAEVRRQLALPPDRPLVLVSFGRYPPPRLDWAALARLTPYLVVTATMPGADRLALPAGIVQVDEAALYAQGLRYEDLVAAVDVVVTKPGYGIVSECLANGTAMLYTERGRFAEYDVLVAGMGEFVRCAPIGRDDLIAGRWQEALDRVLAQPVPAARPRIDGAEVVAELLLRLMA